MVTAEDFCSVALPITAHAKIRLTNDFQRVFVTFFGVSPGLCVHVWDGIEFKLPQGGKFHWFWGFLFLEEYGIKDTTLYHGAFFEDNAEDLQELGEDHCAGNSKPDLSKFMMKNSRDKE